MPALIKSGPKLPAFKKIKKRKREENDQTAEPEKQSSDLPQAKRSKHQESASNEALQNSTGEAENKFVPKKVKKSLQWKKKMAKAKEERLTKPKTEKKATTPKDKSESPAPLQNWNKLKESLPVGQGKPKSKKSTSTSTNKTSSSSDVTSSNSKPSINQVSPTQPIGWNPKNNSDTTIVAMDCEMVGTGPDGIEDSLARVVIINYHGAVIYDQYVRQIEKVTDYRTKVSGIRPQDLEKAKKSLKEAQADVFQLIKDKIVVGHGLKNDFKALLFEHPKLFVRDTAKYKPLQKSPGKAFPLKTLAEQILGVSIQDGEHDPIEDARTALLVYRHVQNNWEASIKTLTKNMTLVNKISKLVDKAKVAASTSKSQLTTNSNTKKDESSSESGDESSEEQSEDSWASSSSHESESESHSDSESDSDSDSD